VALDCAYPNGTTGARNHNDLDEASALLARIEPQDSRLLHLNHELDAALMATPTHLPVAWDGEDVVIAAPSAENGRESAS
jgi:phosphoribosyl 1,2-cyclic phosphodiesterase